MNSHKNTYLNIILEKSDILNLLRHILDKLMATRLIFLFLLTIIMVSNHAQENSEPLTPEELASIAEAPELVPEEIPSPLLTKDQPGPYAIVSSLGLDPDKSLYPVTVISINGYMINPDTEGYSYHLNSGEYLLKVQPEAGNLINTNSIAPPYEPKTYRVRVAQRNTYLLGARILNKDKAEWRLQMFQLQQRLDVQTNNNP